MILSIWRPVSHQIGQFHCTKSYNLLRCLDLQSYNPHYSKVPRSAPVYTHKDDEVASKVTNTYFAMCGLDYYGMHAAARAAAGSSRNRPCFVIDNLNVF